MLTFDVKLAGRRNQNTGDDEVRPFNARLEQIAKQCGGTSIGANFVSRFKRAKAETSFAFPSLEEFDCFKRDAVKELNLEVARGSGIRMTFPAGPSKSSPERRLNTVQLGRKPPKHGL